MILQELDYSEAAEFLGMKEAGFRKLCKGGKGPKARKDGRSYRFLPEHLQEWSEDYKKTAYSANATAVRTPSKGKKKGRPRKIADGLPKELS